MFKQLLKNFIVLILFLNSSIFAKDIDLNSYIEYSQKNSKTLIVWLHKTDCGYCEGMKEFTLQNDTVKEYIEQNFQLVHINISEDIRVMYKKFQGTGKEFALHLGFNLYPTTHFFDKKGEVVYTEIGYYDRKEEKNEVRIYKMLHFIKQKKYLNIDFEEFNFEIKEEL